MACRVSPAGQQTIRLATAVTARALTITAAHSGTHAPGTAGLEYDELVLTGESLPAKKLPEPSAGQSPAELSCCAPTGMVVHAGSGTGVVVVSGGGAEFGRIALRLGEHQPEPNSRSGRVSSR